MGLFGWFNEEDNKTVEHNGYYIDYMSYSIAGEEGKRGSWLIQSPNFLEASNGEKIYLPLYCHSEDGEEINGFNSLEEAEDYIDKYMVTNRGKYRNYNKECHYLIESLLNEVYPKKGERKKDFISRFMSETKDEYKDVKQRFAVCMSYWNRRNKNKKTNESINRLKANKVVYVTYNTNDVIEYLREAKSVIRILYDANIETYFVSDAFGSIHNDLLTAAYDNGYYDKYEDKYFLGGITDPDTFDEYIRCGQLGSFIHKKPYLAYIVFTPNSVLASHSNDLDMIYPVDIETSIGIFSTPNWGLQFTECPLYDALDNPEIKETLNKFKYVNTDIAKHLKLTESVEWLKCPDCGSTDTEVIRSARELEPFKDYTAIEDALDLDFENGTKEQDINRYKCNNCGCEFTKTDVDIKYSKIKNNGNFTDSLFKDLD